MGALTRFQIVWAETKDLKVPAGGDPATLVKLRQHIAAIAGEAETMFQRFEAVPARDDELYGQDVAACAAAAEGPAPDAMKNLSLILWPSADGKTLSKDEAVPASWDAASSDTFELIGRFTVDDHNVSAFSRAVAPSEREPRFVSMVTGTGLPPGTSVYVPREVRRKPVDPKIGSVAFWLAAAAILLFAVACLWSMSVGEVTRTTRDTFAAAGKTCPTSVDPTKVDPAKGSTLFGVPQAWLSTADGKEGECLRAWRDASRSALDASKRDWWSVTNAWLASWTVSDSGRAYSLRMPILLTMASIVMLALSTGLGVMGRPLGLFIDKRNRMSLTKIQFAIWLVILMGPFASYALFNIGFWAEDVSRIQDGVAFVANAAKSDQQLTPWAAKLAGLLEFTPSMEMSLWALLGVSGGTTIVSSFIAQPGGSPAPPDDAMSRLPPRRTRILTNDDPNDAKLADLVYGETAENDGVVDSTRVQTIVITGVLAAIYVSLALETAERIGGLTAGEAFNAGRQVFSSMPPVGATFLWLLGLSHATLLGGKLVDAYKR